MFNVHLYALCTYDFNAISTLETYVDMIMVIDYYIEFEKIFQNHT